MISLICMILRKLDSKAKRLHILYGIMDEMNFLNLLKKEDHRTDLLNYDFKHIFLGSNNFCNNCLSSNSFNLMAFEIKNST